ncbi:MAG: L-threonylcarbamoyladenylate synthase [Acidimicrobiia bacterium]
MIRRATAESIAIAVDILRSGGLVAVPTETVYGLAADATNAAAVRRIFTVKDRPPGHPLIVHIGRSAPLDRWCGDVSVDARKLAAAFWPGPLTMIVPSIDAIATEVTGGRATVGLRMPDHPLTLDLLDAFDGAVAAPSANRFGKVSPTTAAHVERDLDGEVDLILDGGPCRVGVESTIVELVGPVPQILRLGAITAAQIAAVLGREVLPEPVGPARASGMLASHYAPSCAVHIVEDRDEAMALVAELWNRGEGPVDLLDPEATSDEWAHELYGWLREADERRLRSLVVVPPSSDGVGAAVRDRLAKAAAPRP